MKKYFEMSASAFVISLLYALPTYAQGNLSNAGEHLSDAAGRAGTTESNLSTVVGTVINAALTLVGVIFLALMVYAGYLWMTARGESEPVDKAKRIIIGSIIGLVVVLSAYAITAFVTTGFTK